MTTLEIAAIASMGITIVGGTVAFVRSINTEIYERLETMEQKYFSDKEQSDSRHRDNCEKLAVLAESNKHISHLLSGICETTKDTNKKLDGFIESFLLKRN